VGRDFRRLIVAWDETLVGIVRRRRDERGHPVDAFLDPLSVRHEDPMALIANHRKAEIHRMINEPARYRVRRLARTSATWRFTAFRPHAEAGE
jgi:hypothetical protein